MSNHFHLLVVVPEREVFLAGLTDEELMRRVGFLYVGRRREFEAVRSKLAELRSSDPAVAEAFRAGFTRRMADLSVFVQALKRRFSQWYNGRTGRRGALWEERYRSVLVEDGRALEAVAAYIDLNPVRAGLVAEAGKYRWSGYGEALAGGREAKLGILKVVDPFGSGWKEDEALEAYGERLRSVGDGSPPTAPDPPPGRARVLTEGVALGSREFVEGVFRANRGMFGPARATGARKVRGAAGGRLDGLMCLRDLQEGKR
jgi:hypothetical protein